jgi:polyisoprenoid-binding protein YceI
MNKKSIFIGGLVAFVIVAVAGLWAYNAVLGEAEAPSGAITAVPLMLNTATAAPVVAVQATEVANLPTNTAVVANTDVAATETEVASTSETSGLSVFEISQADSQVSFSIYEELGGEPKTVIGTTNQVAGQLALNLDDLSQTQVGVITIDARSFSTDSGQRNNAIRNFILNTNQYEYVTFTPTAVTGLSGAAVAGQDIKFQITGDLTIKDVTKSVTFDVTVNGQNESALTGTATTIIQRDDYGLTIPSVRNVANVGQDVTLQIDFTAKSAA